jgi:hypothetical protein
MLTLINGDGNPRVTAAQDADWYGSLTGEKTCIMPANDKFSATIADANTIEISSGVLITKEGRRVQIDAETIEEIIIPTGTQGTDTYYIIGFHLYIDESGQQVAETFVETMENESDTITETTFREGSTSIYISLYRVKRSGLTLESVTRICPMYELSADEIVYGNTNVGAKLTQINSDLSAISGNVSNLNMNGLHSVYFNTLLYNRLSVTFSEEYYFSFLCAMGNAIAIISGSGQPTTATSAIVTNLQGDIGTTLTNIVYIKESDHIGLYFDCSGTGTISLVPLMPMTSEIVMTPFHS